MSHTEAAPAEAGAPAEAAGPIRPVATVSVYGCAPDEAALLPAAAQRLSLAVRITDAPVTAATAGEAWGSRCISVDHRTRIDAPVLGALRDVGVRYVSTRSTGTDHIDADAARRLGIAVAGAPYAPDGVADYTVMLVLMALRHARTIVTRAETGDFRLPDERGRDLRDLTVGVVGTGRIGTAVIRRLQGFGCRVLAHDRTPEPSAAHVGLDELLRESDVVTLHTPLRPDTRHLLDRARIARMRPGAIVVNTGRGALVDTAALLTALEQGHLGGAALDVLEDEEGVFYTDRPAAHPLLERLQRLPQVLVTPHTAFHTARALHDTITRSLLDCLDFERRHHD